MVTLLFAVTYYAYLLLRTTPNANGSAGIPEPMRHQMSASSLDAVVFGLFSGLSLMLMLSILTARGGFRQSDVDVLFPTPISPRVVMFFRMVRDYLLTLLTPLVLGLFGGRGSILLVSAFVKDVRSDPVFVSKMIGLAWVLVACAWVCLNYGIGFFVNRSDLQADRNKKIVNAIVFTIIVGPALYLVLQLHDSYSRPHLIEVSQSPVVRGALFTATGATWMVIGAIDGDYARIAMGCAILLGTAALGVRLAISQVPYMYDQAAAKGFGVAEQRVMRRNNDFYGLMATRAQSGKLKVGRFSRWIGRLRVSGAAALMWKEVLLQSRGARYLYFVLGPVQLLMVVGPVYARGSELSPSQILNSGDLLMIMQGAGVLMLTLNSATSGFIELLKRVDFQKPLPFRPAGTVFWEVASKCIPNYLFAAISVVTILIVNPALWAYAIASAFFVFSGSLLVSAIVFLTTIAFPDAGDASQRSFRGILVILGTVILASPGVGIYFLIANVWEISPLIAVLPASVLTLVLTIAVCGFSGSLYDSYNPSE